MSCESSAPASGYQTAVDEGLSRVYSKEDRKKITFDPGKDKCIIFSDHHRGVRDGADDFLLCEKAYNAALGYYLESGHTLIILGDAEDLWECRPAPVVKAYEATLRLEADFLKQARYYRVCGNHDDIWGDAGTLDKYFMPAITTQPIPVYDSIALVLDDGNPSKVEIFLTHGHQGTLDSDQLKPISKFFVRNVWRNIQRLLHIRSTTPATDADLKSTHDVAMYHWACKRCHEGGRLILIAGHTHLPVFASTNYAGKLEAELKEMRQALDALRTEGGSATAEMARNVALKSAELEYLKAKGEGRGLAMEKPCYFNTGCCSFSDGDVTAIEISDGEIRLLRWPDDKGYPRPKILESQNLATLLKKL